MNFIVEHRPDWKVINIKVYLDEPEFFNGYILLQKALDFNTGKVAPTDIVINVGFGEATPEILDEYAKWFQAAATVARLLDEVAFHPDHLSGDFTFTIDQSTSSIFVRRDRR